MIKLMVFRRGLEQAADQKRWPRWKKAVMGITVALLFVILMQFFYPHDRALPFARVDGMGVGMQTSDNIVKSVAKRYSATKLTIVVREKTSTVPFDTTGLSPDTTTITKRLTDYPWYWRIVPLSSLVIGATRDVPASMRVDKDRFGQYATALIDQCLVEPKNAGIKVAKDKVELDPAKDGQECTVDDLAKQITAVPLQHDSVKVTIRPQTVKAARQDSDVQPLLAEAAAIVHRPFALSVSGKTQTIAPETIASWLAFHDDKNGNLVIDLDEKTVGATLDKLQKDVYIAPGVTVVRMHDGKETGRAVGAPGRGVDVEATLPLIKKQLFTSGGTVTVTLSSLPPVERYERTYSQTPAGLRALVTDLAKDHKDMAISLRRPGDSGVSANGDKQYHPASTYKLLVAYSVLRRIDSKQISWNQNATGGRTISQCFDMMIVNSDNACAEWFGGTLVGWSVVNREVRALGLNRTSLWSADGFISTTNDQALFLQKLESGKLGISEASRNRLLSAMKRQVYRQGIPAGVGVPVADKVGFLDGLLHDSAIVYSPKGAYILVIYSKGGSWADIADVARQINKHMQ